MTEASPEVGRGVVVEAKVAKVMTRVEGRRRCTRLRRFVTRGEAMTGIGSTTSNG